ncbi:MAG: glycosyltransferase family 2 protein [Campylobacterales bacterium]
MTSWLKPIQNQSNTTLSAGSAKPPLVSIIITNYNYAPFLKECIDSCLAQDYTNFEVVVVDDFSDDNSREIIDSYSDKIKKVFREENKGQLASFFSGLDEALGEFVVFVDADDFLDSDCISTHLFVHLFQKPPVGFTCLRNRQVSENSAIINDYHMDFANNGKEFAYIAPRVIHTPTWSWSTTSAMMFRSDLLKLLKTDMTDEFRVCADYYIVHFANLLGGSMLYDRCRVNYRRHGKNNFSKNFIIGGHRPTGHSDYHAHPTQGALQKAILDKLILKRADFEPYFPSLRRYAEAIAFVTPIDFILSSYKLEDDLKAMLKSLKFEIWKTKQKQIKTKKWAISWAAWRCFWQGVREIRDNILKNFCR